MKNFKSIEYLYPSPPKVDKYSEFTPLDFYSLTIPASKKIQFKLGYFSSGAISTLAAGFATFISNGGKLDLMINHFVNEFDFNLLNDEGELSSTDIKFINGVLSDGDLEQIHDLLVAESQHFFNCLKYLLNHTGQLNIIPVTCADGELSHYKEALFLDENGDKIYINGSGNFTKSGLTGNGESFIIHRSWRNSDDDELINFEEKKFEKIFKKEATDEFVYLDTKKLVKIINEKGTDSNIKELIEDEEELLQKRLSKSKTSIKMKEYYDNLIIENQKRRDRKRKSIRPKFPYENPRQYQLDAYNNWTKNNYKGLFAMATGTGKTLTSLNCLLTLNSTSNVYKAVILVPTVALVDQWKEECEKFNYQNIITISSKENWEKQLGFFNTLAKLRNPSFIIIVTYSSFVRDKFQNYFKKLPKDTLLIADEVHNMGAPSLIKLLPEIHLQKRIGLSATPDRIYDEDGNKHIDSFFEDKAPYTYSFDMKRAINEGYLCRYYYYPHIVTLTNEELTDYSKISKQLAKHIDSSTGKYKKSKEVEILLLKRKRIIHKAENKLGVYRKILNQEYKKRGNLNYSLIYTPEGIKQVNSIEDEYNESKEELRLIDSYTKEVSQLDPFLMVKKYTSNTTDRKRVIEEYAKGNINVLTSMKCLDEGVDVPRSELAIFCSSTGNPRQFIQRRGRVLRLATGKKIATVHDLVVIPKINLEEGETFNMERSLIMGELRRVANFSHLSENKSDTFNELEYICNHYNINLFDIEEEITS